MIFFHCTITQGICSVFTYHGVSIIGPLWRGRGNMWIIYPFQTVPGILGPHQYNFVFLSFWPQRRGVGQITSIQKFENLRNGRPTNTNVYIKIRKGSLSILEHHYQLFYYC